MKSWFITSAVTIVAVLGIRWLAGKRICYRLRYALWLLVLLRLLIPVNFASSEISVARLVDCEPVIQTASTQTISDSICETLPSEKAPPADPTTVLMSLWLGGAALILCFLAGSGFRLQRKLRRDRVLVESGVCPVPVYRTSAVPSPCLVGLFRPVVYVTEAAEGAALRHVLLHEMTHLRHFDHLWTVLRCIVLAVHWFDPLVWIAVWLSKRDGELACDEGVLEYLGEAERIAYGQTLIHLSCKPGKGGTIMMGNAMLDKKGSLRRRIEAIGSGRSTKASMAALIAVLCLLTAGCTFTDAPETTLPKPSIQMQAQITEPVRENAQAQPVQEDTGPQPGYDVWKERTKDILTDREEEMLNAIPGFDSGEEWVEGFKQNVKSNLYKWRSDYGAENAGIVSVEEIFDDRAEPGVRIFEIRCYMGNPRQERSDYMIVSENCKAWTSDLDSCSISDVFNDH